MCPIAYNDSRLAVGAHRYHDVFSWICRICGPAAISAAVAAVRAKISHLRCVLGRMGRLTEMKSLGHQGMIKTLLEEGFAPRLDGIFMYEHEPYLEDLKGDMVHKEEAYGKVRIFQLKSLVLRRVRRGRRVYIYIYNMI